MTFFHLFISLTVGTKLRFLVPRGPDRHVNHQDTQDLQVISQLSLQPSFMAERYYHNYGRASS
jgi:hypothetical protein